MKKISYRIAKTRWTDGRDNWQTKDVKGFAFEHQGFKFCARKTDDFEGPWCVDEYESGLSVVMHRASMKEAVSDATTRIDEKGAKKTRKAINHGLAKLHKGGLL